MAYNTGTDPTLAELITAGFNPAMFSKDTIMHVMSNLVADKVVTTKWKKQLTKGYTVTIPVFSEVSSSEVTPGTEPTPQDAAGTPATITIDKWREATVEISDMSEIEDLADYMSGAAESCAYAISKYIDTTVGALYSTLSSSSAYGSDGQPLIDDIIIAIREGLREADVPNPEMWNMVTDPSGEADIYQIDKFVRSDYGGQAASATGNIGRIYGMKTWISNNLTAATTGNYGVILHPDAIGLVIQQNPRVQVIPKPWEFVTKLQVDVIFGAAEIRDTFGKAFYTRSA